MDRNEILAILKDWNEWDGPKDIGTVRNGYLNRLEDLITGSNQVITITGPRRAGKSYLMRQMARRLIEKGVKKENILFVNFEDPRFMVLDTKLLGQIYDVYQGFLSPTDIPYIFLDEIQDVNGWEKWVCTMHELRKAKIIVSGSNAHLLSRELGTFLTGRHIDLTVLPLSFTEYLMFNNIQFKSPVEIIGKEEQINGLLYKFMETGSFPEVALSVKKKEILLSYFDDIFSKDLIKRFRVRKGPVMKSLIKYYLSNAGNLITFTSAGKFLQTNTDTIERFSEYFENVYLVFFLKRFSFKVKEQEKSPRKVFAVDTGLCNAVGFRFSDNWGKLAENIVFLELKRRQLDNPVGEVYFWKDDQHREVDFIIKEGLKVVGAIQVCWDVEASKTRERELKSLLKALKELGLTEGLVITDKEESVEVIDGFKVIFVPLWKWLIFPTIIPSP